MDSYYVWRFGKKIMSIVYFMEQDRLVTCFQVMPSHNFTTKIMLAVFILLGEIFTFTCNSQNLRKLITGK